MWWDQQGWPHSVSIVDKKKEETRAVEDQARPLLWREGTSKHRKILEDYVYAAMRVRLTNASGTSLRSDAATVSNGLAVYPTCCATQSVGICSMAML